MFIARYPIEQTDPPRSAKESLPTMYDLPSEDTEESGLPDEFHLWQSELCSATFCPSTYSPEQVFVVSDLNLYYDVHHPGWYKRPERSVCERQASIQSRFEGRGQIFSLFYRSIAVAKTTLDSRQILKP